MRYRKRDAVQEKRWCSALLASPFMKKQQRVGCFFSFFCFIFVPIFKFTSYEMHPVLVFRLWQKTDIWQVMKCGPKKQVVILSVKLFCLFRWDQSKKKPAKDLFSVRFFVFSKAVSASFFLFLQRFLHNR